MAAGGRVLMPATPAMVCTPLAMHGGNAPPLVVPATATVRLTVHPGFSGFRAEIDGHLHPATGLAYACRCATTKSRWERSVAMESRSPACASGSSSSTARGSSLATPARQGQASREQRLVEDDLDQQRPDDAQRRAEHGDGEGRRDAPVIWREQPYDPPPRLPPDDAVLMPGR